MRSLSCVLVAALATTAFSAVAPAPAHAHAKPSKPRAELVVRPPLASYSGGQVTVSALVKNKGSKRAARSRTEFFLSKDSRRSADDASLGNLPTPKLKPKAGRTLLGALALPVGSQPGAYRLIACADATGVVKERKEQNNCKASGSAVTLPGGPPPPGKVNVNAAANVGGSVAVSGVSGGACTGTFCVLTSGASTVTFTPTAAAGYRFGGWSGCTGFTGTTAITFTNPTASQDCTAGFVRQVTINWTVVPLVPVVGLGGTVTGVASHGSCTASNPLNGSGSCLVDAGVGTVTLLASPLLLPTFKGWTGAGCASLTNPLVLTSPNAGLTCTASFGLL